MAERYERIRRAREKAGITRQALGAAAGYTADYVSKIERGQVPRYKMCVLDDLEAALRRLNGKR